MFRPNTFSNILRTISAKTCRQFHVQNIPTLKMTLEDLVEVVEKKIQLLTNANDQGIKRAEDDYATANSLLKREIANLKKTLIALELTTGELQYSVPAVPVAFVETPQPEVIVKPESPSIPAPKLESVKPTEKRPTEPKNQAVNRGKKPAAPAGDEPLDISRIDMRVGKIVEVERHPDAESLYVEKVDLGEGHLRTILSGLVKAVPLEKMQGLVGIFMCNLKPAKMRGIESQGMLMCATDAAGTVEPLVITDCSDPNGPVLGDVVYVAEFPGEPDAQLNPKKKVLERVKPDMRVDHNHVATFRGAAWHLRGDPSAVIRAPTVVDAQIS